MFKFFLRVLLHILRYDQLVRIPVTARSGDQRLIIVQFPDGTGVVGMVLDQDELVDEFNCRGAELLGPESLPAMVRGLQEGRFPVHS